MMLIKWSTTAACRLLAVTTVALLFSLVGISEAITPAELKWPSCDINGLQYTVNDCLNKLDNNLKKMRINEGNNSLVRRCCSIREFGHCLNSSAPNLCEQHKDRVSFVEDYMVIALNRNGFHDQSTCEVCCSGMVDCILVDKAVVKAIFILFFLVFLCLFFYVIYCAILDNDCINWFVSTVISNPTIITVENDVVIVTPLAKTEMLLINADVETAKQAEETSEDGVMETSL